MPKTTVDQHAADELELYLENDEPLYRQTQNAYLNLLHKQKRGKYDRDKAVLLFQYIADAAANKYVREFSAGKVADTFNKATRTAVAVSLRDSFEAQERSGELARLKEKL